VERQCPICNRRRAENETLCAYHQRAYINLREKYDQWKTALGISWDEYLREVIDNPNTGEWVREVAQHILQGEGAQGLSQPHSS
jgi:hypothetical protein